MTPVVLQHGLFGFTDIGIGKLKITYFNRIDRAIAERGHPLIVPRVHPTASIARRAAAMKRAILDQTPVKSKVIIFAHSMGGLDARYMISRLGMEDRVEALITVCTPHRGSAYADWCLANIGKRLGGLKLMTLLGLDVRAVRDLTAHACQRFNEKYRDVPGVKYFSVAGQCPWKKLPPIFMHSAKVVEATEGPNDGIVSVASATWGEHLGTWPADHLHVINKRVLPEFSRRTGTITARYLEILDRLTADGRPVRLSSDPGDG